VIDWRGPLHKQIETIAKAVARGGEFVVQNTQMTVASAYAALIVDFAAVGHTVAARAGGVVAPAHAARVALLATESYIITAYTRVVSLAHATPINYRAAKWDIITPNTRITTATNTTSVAG
jgi:hypothetical protein